MDVVWLVLPPSVTSRSLRTGAILTRIETAASNTSGDIADRPMGMVGLYNRWARGLNHLQSPLLLVLRLYWGWQFFVTGKGKLTNLGKVTEFFASLNIPVPHLNAILAGCTECFGGILLLVGLGSRIITVPMIFTMCIAFLTAHLDITKHIFQNPDAFVTAPPFLFMLCCVIVLVFGPGVFSIDHLLRRRPKEGLASV